MKISTGTAIFFAASIALAVGAPPRRYYRPVSYDSEEYPESSALLAAQQPYTLAEAPYFFQPRTLDISPRGRKYQIVRRKKKPNQGAPLPGSDEDEDDEPQDEEDDEESSEEEADEEGGGQDGGDEEEFDTPPWEELFPDEDKNTGTFNDQPGGSGYGGQGGNNGQGGSLANLPVGGPAPESGGSLMNLFGFGSSEDQGGQQGGGQQGGPPQYRQGRPRPQQRPRRPQTVRARTSLPAVEEPRTGGAVLYDGYNYIPVKPVQVRIPQRQAKTIKQNEKIPTARQNKKLKSNKQYVLVPVGRDSREIRFSRDEHGFKVENGPIFAPSEIWRWEGPGGRPLRRRENRPSGVFYTGRPQRGSNVRFSEDSDY